MRILSDFLEVFKQYREDNRSNKLSYYFRLLREYREDRDEDIRISEDFKYIDLEAWEE